MLAKPSYYYVALSDQARTLDIREAEYIHVMDGPSAIVDWVSSPGLRPFLNALDTDAERQRSVDLLNTRVAGFYPQQRDGKVPFPFRRLVVVTYR